MVKTIWLTNLQRIMNKARRNACSRRRLRGAYENANDSHAHTSSCCLHKRAQAARIHYIRFFACAKAVLYLAVGLAFVKAGEKEFSF